MPERRAQSLLKTAMQLFTQKGIRAVRMDDVASELSISKRTLYEIYENKELLLYESTRTYYRQRREMMQSTQMENDTGADSDMEDDAVEEAAT